MNTMTTSGIEQMAAKQWATRPADQRFQNLNSLYDAVANRRNRTKAMDIEVSDLHVTVDDNNTLMINDRLQPATPTHWAFGQLSTLSSAPAGYLRQLPAKLAADCLNYSIERAPREAFKIMTVRNDDGNLDTLNAVTSTKYGRIWDADCVAAVQRIVDRSNGKFFNPKDWSGTPSGLYASDRDVFMFLIDGGSMVDGGGERDKLNRGFICWNSETGSRTFGLMTFLFRQVCGNHLIWGAENVSKLILRHSSGGPARFDSEAMPVLIDYVNASSKPQEECIIRAKNTPLKELGPATAEGLDDEWINYVAKNRSFSRGELRDAIKTAEREEGQCATLWDLVNGLTASARELAFVDARFDLEKRAGNLLKLVETN